MEENKKELKEQIELKESNPDDLSKILNQAPTGFLDMLSGIGRNQTAEEKEAEELRQKALQREYEILREEFLANKKREEELEADRILKVLSSPFYEPKGETSVEKLTDLMIQIQKNCWKGMNRQEKDESILVPIEEGNIKLENNEWFITIYLGGSIPKTIKLADYYGWEENSEDFNRFVQLYESKNLGVNCE